MTVINPYEKCKIIATVMQKPIREKREIATRSGLFIFRNLLSTSTKFPSAL